MDDGQEAEFAGKDGVIEIVGAVDGSPDARIEVRPGSALGILLQGMGGRAKFADEAQSTARIVLGDMVGDLFQIVPELTGKL